jgi:hypothetical protein
MAKNGKYAVCVGINDYPGVQNDLMGCKNDAADWEAELKDRGFGVTKLIDKAATKSAIVDAIAATIAKASKGDLVVFTYSGHGSWQPDSDGDEDDGRDEGWCPRDIGTNGLLVDDDIYELFGKLADGARLVMLSDSCHSGTVSRMAFAPGGNGQSAPRVRFMAPERFLKPAELKIADRIKRVRRSASAKPHRALLISGCMDHEYSYDASFGGRANGAFTYFALKALAKLKSKADYVEWHAAIRKQLPNQSHPQSPVLSGTKAQKAWKVLE